MIVESKKRLTQIQCDGWYYRVSEIAGEQKNLADIKFQVGRTRQVGVNGIHCEDLLAILIDRLSRLQQGQFVCAAHETVIVRLREISDLLRTREEPCDLDALKLKLYGKRGNQ